MSEPRKKKRSKKPKKTVPQDVQTINVGTSSKSRGASSLPREPSSVSMEDVETEVAPLSKEDVQTSDVRLFSDEDFQTIGTSSKSEGKERASSLPREPSSVSMEDVESTEVAKDREASSTTPSVEEIKKWKRSDVIKCLQENKEDLDLDDEDIEIIRTNKVAGQAFLLLTEEKLLNNPYNLAGGPASSIAYLVETLGGGEVTRKRKYEESPEVLTEIVRSAVRDEFSRQNPNKISVSDLSQSEMRNDVGLRNIVLLDEDFQSLESVPYRPFRWDTDMAEDQQMDDVVTWFKNALKLPRGFYIKDVHTQKNYQRRLQGASVTLTGGTDISIGPSGTPCVWIETKKEAEDFNEGQAIGELFLIDKLYPTRAMTVLTDCNNYWNIYYFLTTEDEKQCIVTCNISDRGVALAIIKEFVLEEGTFFNELLGKDVTYEVKLPEPLKKKAKFLDHISEADNEDRMADMVGDMSEQELFNMTVRKRLMLVRDFCRLDEQPQTGANRGKKSINKNKMTIIKISEVLIFLIFAEKAFMNASDIIQKSLKTKLNPQTDLESRYGSIEVAPKSKSKSWIWLHLIIFLRAFGSENNWIGRVGGNIGLLEVISFENQTERNQCILFGNIVYRENVDRKNSNIISRSSGPKG
ncbi:unnamed protein product [Rhizophagus irregularis]|nr:unnamed protein product [Rhizophagus irregularis]